MSPKGQDADALVSDIRKALRQVAVSLSKDRALEAHAVMENMMLALESRPRLTEDQKEALRQLAKSLDYSKTRYGLMEYQEVSKRITACLGRGEEDMQTPEAPSEESSEEILILHSASPEYRSVMGMVESYGQKLDDTLSAMGSSRAEKDRASQIMEALLQGLMATRQRYQNEHLDGAITRLIEKIREAMRGL